MLQGHSARLAGALCLLAVGVGSASAQSTAPPMSERAQRYYQILAENPRPGYLFDRFHNTWMETSTSAQLEDFLRDQARENPRIELLLAFLYEAEARDVEALGRYEAALERLPQAGEILLHRARAQMTTLAFEQAVADLQGALEHDLDDELRIEARKLLGQAQLRAGRPQEALATWRELTEAMPHEEGLREELIDLQLDEGLFEEAIAHSRDLIENTFEPYRAAMHRLRLGEIQARAGSKADALETYRQTLQRAGAGTWLEREVLARIEQLHRSEDDIAGLEQQYAALRAAMPQRMEVVRRHAALLAELDRMDEAVETFQALLRITPHDRGVREEFIRMLQRGKRFTEAAQAAAALARQFPRDAELIVLQADIHHQAEQTDAAVAAIERYLELSGDSEYAHLRSARLLAGYSRPQEAAAIYDRLVAMRPQSIIAREARADHWYATGQKAEAVRELLLLAEDGGLENVLRIARDLQRRGEHESALGLLERHEAAHGQSYVYLTVAHASAAALRRDSTLRYARARVTAAGTPLELDIAVNDTLSAAAAAGQLESLRAELEASEPRSVNAECLLVSLLETVDLPEEAEQALATALEAHPRSVLLWNQKVQLARRRMDWRGASEALGALVGLDPARRSLYLQRLVEMHQRAGEVEPALRRVAEWKAASPTAVEPYVVESQIHAQAGDAAKAAEVLRAAALRFPENLGLMHRLAGLYVAQQRYDDATSVYWRLLEREEDLARRLGLVRDLARVSEMQGRTERLIYHFETRMRTDPTSLFGPLALVQIYDVLDDYSRRREYLMRASQIRPDDVGLLREVARVQEQDGEYEQAIQTLQRAMPLDDTGASRQLLAHLHLVHGDAAQGERLLLETRQDHLVDAAATVQVAEKLLAAGQYRIAADLMERALAAAPEDYRLAYLRAVALEEQGEHLAAIEALLTVLDARGQVPDAATSQQMMMFMGPWMDPLAIPPGVNEIIRTAYAQHMAYAYREAAQHMRGFFGGGSLTPPSQEWVEPYVMAHLRELSRQLPDASQQRLIVRLQDRGVLHAELKLSVDFEGREGPTQAIREAWQRHPQDETLAALLAMITAFEGADEEDLPEVYVVLRDRGWTQMAIVAALGTDDEEYAPIRAEAMELLAGVEKPGMLLLAALMRRMEQMDDDDEQTARTIQILLELYPRMDKAGGMVAYMFFQIAHLLAGAEHWEEYVRLLDMEAGEVGPAGGGMSPMAMMMGMHSREQLLVEMTFPPQALPDFSPQVLLVLQGRGRWGMGEPVTDFEGVKPHLSVVGNPSLGVLLHWLVGDEEEVERRITSLIDRPHPELGHQVLAAHWHAVNERRAQAAELLTRARYMPMSAAERRQIDAMLLSLAVQGGEELKELGQAAAMRLRRHRLQPQQRAELREAMLTLGLTQEAEEIQDTQVGISHPGRHHRGQEERIRQLISEGRTEQAARLVARDFEQQVQQSAGTHGWDPVAQGVREINRMGLLDEVRQFLHDSAEGGRIADRVALARLLEEINEPQEAMEHYRKVIEVRPGEPTASIRLALLVDDEAEQWELITSAGQRWPELLAAAMVAGLERSDEAGNQRKMVLAVQALARMDERQLISVSPYVQTSLASILGESRHAYDDDEASGTDELPWDDRLAEFLTAMVVVPGAGDTAFDALLRMHRTAGRLEDAQERLQELAMDALFRRPDLSARGGMHYYGREPDRMIVTPEYFLVAGAWRRGEMASLDELPRRLTAERRAAARARLERLRLLFEASDEDFLQAARPRRGPEGDLRTVVEIWHEMQREVLLSDLMYDQLRQLPPDAFEYMVAVVPVARWAQVLHARHGDEALGEFLDGLWSLVNRPSRSGRSRGDDPPSGPTYYGKLLSQLMRDENLAVPVLAAAMRNPELCRSMHPLSADVHDIHWRLRETSALLPPIAHATGHWESLRQTSLVAPLDAFDPMLLADGESSLLAIAVAHARLTPDAPERSPAARLLAAVVPYRPAVAADGTALSSPWAYSRGQAQWERTDRERARYSRGSTILPRIARRDGPTEAPGEPQAGRPTPPPGGVLEALRATEPQTFGTELLIVLIEAGSVDAVYEFMGTQWEALETLDQPRRQRIQQALAACLRRLELDMQGELSPVAMAYLSASTDALGERLRDEARQISSPSTRYDYQLTEHMQSVGRLLLRTTVDAGAYTDDVLELLAEGVAPILRRHLRGSSAWLHAQPDLAVLVWGASQVGEDLAGAPLLLERLSTRLDPTLDAYRLVSQAWANSIRKGFFVATPGERPAIVSTAGAVMDALGRIDALFGGDCVPGLARVVLEAAGLMSADELAALANALDDIEDLSDMMQEARVVVELVRWRQQPTEEAPAGFVEHYRRRLQDEGLHPTWRVGMVAEALRNDLWAVWVHGLSRQEYYSGRRDAGTYPAGDELRRSALDLTLRHIDQLGPEGLLNALLWMEPLPRDDAWPEAAATLMDAWERSGGQIGSEDIEQLYRGMFVLHTRLRLGQRDKVDETLMGRSDTLRRSPAVWAVLLETPDVELITRVLEKVWQDAEGGHDRNLPSQWLMGASQRGNADAVLAAMPEGDMRLLAEAMFASLGTPGSDRGYGPSRGGSRWLYSLQVNAVRASPQPALEEVARGLDDWTFDDERVLDKVVDLLLVERTWGHLRAQVRRRGEAIVPASLMRRPAGEDEQDVKLYGWYLAILAEEGQMDRLAEIVGQLQTASRGNRDEWHVRERFRRLLEPAAQRVLGDARQLMEAEEGIDDILARIETVRNLFAGVDSRVIENLTNDFRSHIWTLLFLSDRLDELPRWETALSDPSDSEAIRKGARNSTYGWHIVWTGLERHFESLGAAEHAAIIDRLMATDTSNVGGCGASNLRHVIESHTNNRPLLRAALTDYLQRHGEQPEDDEADDEAPADAAVGTRLITADADEAVVGETDESGKK